MPKMPLWVLFVSLLLAAWPAGPCSLAGGAPPPPAEERSSSRPTAGIRGEIVRPGAYALSEGETLSSLILRAGGYTDNAWLPGAALFRMTEKARQAAELDRIGERLETARGPGPGGTGSPGSADFVQVRRFLDGLRNLSPTGRIPVRLSHPRLLINGPEDLRLEEGDTLVVPAAPRTVRVTGAVCLPGEYPASPGARIGEILPMAGGLLPEADREGTILLKADGGARMLAEGWIVWNAAAGRWEVSLFRQDHPRIEPGDTIFVPRDPGGMKWPGGIDDYRRTMMRILEITGPEPQR